MDVNIGYMLLSAREQLLEELQTATHQTTISPGAEALIEIDGEEERILYMNNSGSFDDVLVITPQSPIGEAISGRSSGERVSYTVGNNQLEVIIKNIE